MARPDLRDSDLAPHFTRLSSAVSDRYRVDRELGAGGMATVYLAEDVKHHRRVAIKVLKPDLAAVIGAERFLREIHTVAALQHPHILGLIDSGEASGSAYFVMPYVEGESLRDLLTREKQLPIADAVRIATEVASALDYAHRHGVIHRDIKPENILLHDGAALVADFGIALAVSRSENAARMTETGMSLGTPQYMSPEQAMGERDIGPRSDIYALGATTYEMLTGDPPFTGATVQAIVARVMSAEPDRPSLVRKTIPGHVEAAVLCALAKLPADRFGTAADFSAAITSRAPGFPASHPLPRAETVSPVEVGRGHRLLLLAAGVAIAAGGIAGGWLLGRERRPATTAGPIVSASVLLPDSLQIEPQLFMPEGTETLALSPDGRQLVIAAGHGATSHLYLRTLSRFGLRRLDGTDGAQAPFFSRSGDAVYFFGPQGLARVTLTDGRVSTLRPPPTGSFENEAWGGTVTPAGNIVLSQRLATELIILTPDGDSVRTIRCTTTCGYPQALPDARHVLVSTGDALWVADLETGEGLQVKHRAASGGEETLRAVAGDPDGAGHLVYTTLDGRLYAAPFDAAAARLTGPAVEIADSVRIESGRGGAQIALSAAGVLAYVPGDIAAVGNLVRADRAGRLDTIPAQPDDYDGFALSPDGRRLAARVATAGGGRIEVIDVVTGRVTPWLASQRLGVPSWTRDGHNIVYTRGDTPMIGNPDRSAAPTPLPAGTSIAGSVYTLADSVAYVVHAKDSVSVLRDGQRIGRAVSIPAEAIYAVTDDGRWAIEHGGMSADGAMVALALDGSGRRVVLAPMPYSMPTQAAGGTELIAAMVGTGNAVAGRAQTLQTFYSITYDAASSDPFGTPRKLFTTTVADFPGRNYAVGMGGNRFVFKQPVASPPLREVRVLTSWTSHLAPAVDR
jgi:serine/threonine-protein kinase